MKPEPLYHCENSKRKWLHLSRKIRTCSKHRTFAWHFQPSWKHLTGDISVSATKAISAKCKLGVNSLPVFNRRTDKIALVKANGLLSHQLSGDYCYYVVAQCLANISSPSSCISLIQFGKRWDRNAHIVPVTFAKT